MTTLACQPAKRDTLRAAGLGLLLVGCVETTVVPLPSDVRPPDTAPYVVPPTYDVVHVLFVVDYSGSMQGQGDAEQELRHILTEMPRILYRLDDQWQGAWFATSIAADPSVEEPIAEAWGLQDIEEFALLTHDGVHAEAEEGSAAALAAATWYEVPDAVQRVVVIVSDEDDADVTPPAEWDARWMHVTGQVPYTVAIVDLDRDCGLPGTSYMALADTVADVCRPETWAAAIVTTR